MKTIVISSVLLFSALTLITGCRTGSGPGSYHASSNAGAPNQNAAPRPYYQSHAEGRFFHQTSGETKPGSEPMVRRYRPTRNYY